MLSTRELIFVLGMHRSGTSLATRLIQASGYAVPSPVLAATADNPQGYSEPAVLVRANNRMLAELGLSWHDDQPPDEAAYTALRLRWRARLHRLLRGWLRRHPALVLKDPRLCRLFPLWRQAAEDCGANVRVLLVSRSAGAVADSLARRYDTPAFRPAAIVQRERADLLHLRYWLDAEQASRGLPRAWLRYEDLQRGKDGALRELLGAGWDERRLRHLVQTPSGTDMAAPDSLSGVLERDPLTLPGQAALDCARADLDRISQAFAPLRDRPRSAPDTDPLATDVLRAWQQAQAARHLQLRHVLMVSGAPASRGHIYRLQHTAAALSARDIAVSLEDQARPDALRPDTDLLLVFRVTDSPALQTLMQEARAQGATVVYDIDDAVFEPGLMQPEHFDYLRVRPQLAAQWRDSAPLYQRALASADAALLTTAPLARLAGQYQPRVWVVPNGLGAERLQAPRHAPSRETVEDRIIVGYASGTPTHQRDFAEVAPALCTLLARHPTVHLCLLGHLDLDEFPELAQHAPRIECRGIVDFEQLPAELARFDINLAPLQIGNPFCEAKSELKVFEAGAVGVPSIASATEPMRGAILHGRTGLLVNAPADWDLALDRLVQDRGLRQAMGCMARHHALARFGPAARADAVLAALAEIRDSRTQCRAEGPV